MSAKKIAKTPYLDGVRGWAAFAVVVFHQSSELFVHFRHKSPVTSLWQPFLGKQILK
jgi:peptidoglycan/LPS O-acetylase OafA/YrhL